MPEGDPVGQAAAHAYALAMHLHASASESAGSVRSQLARAALNGLDVAWFADHDWRRHRLLFRQTYSFTANETQMGGTWNAPKIANTGSLATGSGGVLVSTPVSPNDPAARKGSLRPRATSSGSAAASVRHRINAESSRATFRGRAAGRTVALDVLPSRNGVDAWGEVRFQLSHQPAAGIARGRGIPAVPPTLRHHRAGNEQQRADRDRPRPRHTRRLADGDARPDRRRRADLARRRCPGQLDGRDRPPRGVPATRRDVVPQRPVPHRERGVG